MLKIDWTKWSAIAEILSAIAIVLTLLYLADQTRQLSAQTEQNRELLTAQARSDREAVRRTAFTRYIENPELIRVTVKAERGEALSDEEAFLLDRANRWSLNDWANIFREYQEGLLDASALPGDAWKETFRRAGSWMESTWLSEKPYFSDEFVRWMEENVIAE